MNKILLIAMLMILAIAITACNHGGSDGDVAEVVTDLYVESLPVEAPPKEIDYQIVFTRPDAYMTMFGYVATTQVDNVSFFFREDDHEFNAQFVNTTMELLSVIDTYITLPERMLSIRLTDGDITNYKFDTRITRSITINCHSDKSTFGWLVHCLYIGRIPVWLAAGIEAVAKSDIGLFTPDYTDMVPPDGFGDYLFSPGFWNTELGERGVNTAYRFVRHLIETDELEALIGLFEINHDDWECANVQANQLFQSLFGRDMDNSIRLVFHAMRGRTAHGAYTLFITSDMCNYYFIFDCFSDTEDNLMVLVDALDMATLFTVDWYSKFKEFEFVPINVNAFVSGSPSLSNIGGVAFNNHVQLNRVAVNINMLITMVHEVSHIMNQMTEMAPIIPLDEGLATALGLLFLSSEHAESIPPSFLLQTPNSEVLLFGEADRSQDMLIYSRSRILIEHYIAYYRLNYTDYVYGGGPYGSDSYGSIGFLWRYTDPYEEGHIAEINTYSTAASFVLYLLATYGEEMYIQVHENADNFINVYGRTIHELIEEWRAFLIDLSYTERDVFKFFYDFDKEHYADNPNVTWVSIDWDAR